jgi:cytochrome c biogenesis protein CcmG, thiol:disulfide interchange protein DsbE
MSPRRRRLLALGLGVALAAVLWVGLTAFTAPPARSAAPFSLPRLGGGPRVTMPMVGEGAHDPVVLTFFASWCGPCHSELPTMARVARHAEHSHAKVRFIGIDDDDAASSGLAFVRSSGVSFPVGRDFYVEVAPTYDVAWTPSTVFIDGDGTIARTVRGPVSAATLRSEMAAISGT